jgi:ATP-binding cassette subfamily B protein/subfamily B ATP-binding cassette protein MsbA
MTIWIKLWPEIKNFRKQFIQVVVLGAITSVLKGLIPELTNRLFSAWQTQNHTLAWTIPPVLALIWIASCVTRFYHLYIMKYTANRISVNQRRVLMEKYLSLNLSFFQEAEQGTGGLISRMLNDINIIQTGVDRVADVFREPILAIGMLGYLMYLDWRLTAFILLAMPVVTAVLRNLARSLRKYSRRNQEIMENLTRTLKESLDGTRIVQSFALEGEMRRKFNEQANNFLETRKSIIAREELAGPVSESLTVIFISTLLLYIGYQVFQSHFTLANFMSFMFAMGLLQDSIRKLQDAYIKVQQAAIGMDRLHAVLDTKPTVSDPATAVPFPTDWQEIEFRNVSFAFNKEMVLKNVNLTIHRSETVALVGSSGSGKSTIANLLQRFFDPISGDIFIGGISIKQFTLHDLRKHIALVTQDVFLFNESIERNILMGDLTQTPEKVVAAAKLANADAFIRNTPNGYQTSVGDFGNRMSGGEKQRVSIARAIVKDAPILILDEATSALDSENELEVQKGLNQLLQGRTALVIAHRLSTISKADRIVVLKKGEIIEQGNHAQLLERQGEYFKFYQMQR